MPMGNPMGYLNKRASGIRASAANNRLAQAVMKHPYRSSAIGAAGLYAGGSIVKRRKSGLNKGRSSMYRY